MIGKLTKLASGPLGDRFARRPLIATGYGMAALGKIMVAAFASWQGVLAGRVVARYEADGRAGEAGERGVHAGTAAGCSVSTAPWTPSGLSSDR